MDIDILDLEKRLKENSRNSTEELLQYVLFEIQSPIEDYFLAVDSLLVPSEGYANREQKRR